MVGRNMSLKNPVTPQGIDPRTVRLVEQRLNHYATPGPTKSHRYYLKAQNTAYHFLNIIISGHMQFSYAAYTRDVVPMHMLKNAQLLNITGFPTSGNYSKMDQ